MKRSAFVFGSLAVCSPERIRSAPVVPTSDLVARIPGVTGIYARTLDDAPPLVSVRAREPFASASVIKLAIMLTAYQAFDAGTAAPSDAVRLRASDLIGGSPRLATARAGERYRLSTLLEAMIRESDNSASNALISTFGFTSINTTIAAAGLAGTRLGRHFADVVPAWHISANLTTPYDMAALLYEIERGSREGLTTVARSASCRAMIDTLLGQEDRSKIPSGLPAQTPCANKTGEITGVRNDAAIVDPYGDAPFILVVLTRALDDTAAGDRGIAAIAARVDAAVRAGRSGE